MSSENSQQTAGNRPPSDEARRMRRSQDKTHEENVIALFNKRTEYENGIRQVNADLDHIGYNWPMTAPQPKRLTTSEWLDLLNANKESVYLDSFVSDLQESLFNARKQVELQMAKVAHLKKAVKALSSAKKKK